MNILIRLINRIRFKKTVKTDESQNVVVGMAKARRLYRELAVKTHPDKHPYKRDIAEDITARLTCNKHNYIALLKIQEEIEKNCSCRLQCLQIWYLRINNKNKTNMSTIVSCPYCGSYNTAKTVNGRLSDALAKTGSVVGGALLNMVTGGVAMGLIGANIGYGRSWHQFCCSDCHEAFKVRLGVCGGVKEIKKY